jgi:hypothetical protein
MTVERDGLRCCHRPADRLNAPGSLLSGSLSEHHIVADTLSAVLDFRGVQITGEPGFPDVPQGCPSTTAHFWLLTHAGVAPSVGVQWSEERHPGRFLLPLGETGTGGGDAGRQIHLVRAHCRSAVRIRRDHHNVAALLAQGLDLAR